MDFMQALLSSANALIYYAALIAVVWKLFQISADMAEIKTLLKDGSKNQATAVPRTAAAPASVPEAGPISLESAEALLRQVAAESHALEQTKPNV